MRDTKVDLLRFIGLILIVFAHCEPPTFLFQVRNFDVPLMVIVSGISFNIAYKRKDRYSNYLLKRTKRLVFPVWIFLTGYFLVSTMLLNKAFSIREILESYLFFEGIGYVWIIRVFLIVAILAPFLHRFCNRVNSNNIYLGILSFGFLVSELLFIMYKITSPQGNLIYITSILMYIIPYSLLFSIGLRLNKLSNKLAMLISTLMLSVFTGIALLLFNAKNEFVPTQIYKYPPSIYFLSFAIGLSLLLYISIDKIDSFFKSFSHYNKVLFIARNSIWVYLWHIPYIELINMHYYFKFPFVLLLASCTVYIQVTFLNIILKKIKNENVKKHLKIIFTG